MPIPTPEDTNHLSPRELAAHAQSDVTSDPNEGLVWGLAAWNRTKQPDVAAEDPTLAGEVAAELALRSAQAAERDTIVDDWLQESFERLSGEDERSQREWAATAIIGIRITILRGDRQGRLSAGELEQARTWQREAERRLREQHHLSQPWDRYGTLLMQRSAVNEGLFGHPIAAIGLAARGIWRAIQANDEGEPPDRHQAWVNKHVGSNVDAAVLAVSKIVEWAPPGRRLRNSLKQKLVN